MKIIELIIERLYSLNLTFSPPNSDNVEVQQRIHQQKMENVMHSIDNHNFTIDYMDNQLNKWLANLPLTPTI